MRLITIFSSLILILSLNVSGCHAAEIKEPAVAGAFYPGDPEILKKDVDRYLSAVHPANDEPRPIALVVPHAGYLYSGGVAAEGYARLKGHAVSTVILIGPSHRAPLNGAAIHPGDGMRTPLGVVAVNTRLARSLASEAGHVRLDAAPFSQEHSLEVQLPFIQRALSQECSVVPILVGNPDRESLATLTAGIGRILKEDPHALLVISSDLSHYHEQTTALDMDNRVIDAMERLSINEMERLLNSGKGEMCGGWPAIYGILAARAAGATYGVRYRSATSGDVTGDKKSVVGYVSLGILRSKLSESQKKQVLELARDTVARHVKGEKLPDSTGGAPILSADGATFVTLNDKNGHLRGCIGTILPQMSLYASVIHNAVSAASHDPRFPPVKPDELAGLRVEVTVLSPLEALPDVKGIVIGTHGLLLEKEGRSSVFLPQVPVEQKWDLPTYLSELALKAGLPPDGWKGAHLSVFTAEVIK